MFIHGFAHGPKNTLKLLSELHLLVIFCNDITIMRKNVRESQTSAQLNTVISPHMRTPEKN